VQLHCQAIQDKVDHLVLDSSYIDISSIYCGDEQLEYKVDERHQVYGSRIDVKLPSVLGKDDMIKITIKYSTTDKCTAVQW
jgi:leukotriene-A4 hydrolase